MPERTAVALGDGLQAYRYEGLEVEGEDRVATVYASPTTEGVATVACLAPPADADAFKGECEAAANTLQLTSGEPFKVGADAAYAKLLGTTFGKLDADVAKGRRALGRSGATFRAQAAAARDIQAAYAAAARKLRAADTSPADVAINAALAKSLHGRVGRLEEGGVGSGGQGHGRLRALRGGDQGRAARSSRRRSRGSRSAATPSIRDFPGYIVKNATEGRQGG